MLKVSVYQKDDSMAVPVCYCFGWTRERIVQAVKENQQPIDRIREQVQANRCGCEVNNPQGSCCLGNVTTFIRSLDKS
ncbi:BFD-like [2Fe-2S] binding domain protein [compost metagenome]